MTVEELLEMLKSGDVGNINEYYIVMFIKYLEELEDLREEYKNVSEAFMKVNNSIFDTKMDLNKVKQELNKVKQELENVISVAEFQRECSIERGFRVKELEEELKEEINNILAKAYSTNSRIVHIERFLTIEDLTQILGLIEDGEQFNQLTEVRTMTIEISKNDLENIIWALMNLRHVIAEEKFIEEGADVTLDKFVKLELKEGLNKND